MQNLNDWLSHLEAIHPTEIEMGLERIRMVAQRLGVERPANIVITVAGTNGKGSTVTTCTSILKEAGLRVGSYMSPHIHHYSERVRINGHAASDADLCLSFAAVEAARGDISLTYFEFGTLAAMWLFKEQEVDAAVLEVGLGGRLDAVNVVEPDVAVVTSIGLDHQDWLGNDIADIAREKAGVFRSNKPAICGERQPPESLFAVADGIGADVKLKGRDYDFSEEGFDDRWSWSGIGSQGQKIQLNNLPVPGLPIENAATALQALHQLDIQLSDDVIRMGLARAQLAGRLQRFKHPMKGIMDVGHNPQAADLLKDHLEKRPVEGKRYAVVAMLGDKDAQGVVKPLVNVVDEWLIAGLNVHRGQSATELLDKVQPSLKDAAVQSFESVSQALDFAAKTMDKDDEVVILGSFFTVAEAQTWLEAKRLEE